MGTVISLWPELGQGVAARRWLAALSRLSAVLVLLAAGCEDSPRFLKRPNRAALDSAGLLHVSDYQHHRIVVFDQQGRYVRQYGSVGLGENELWHVYGLQAGQQQDMWLINERLLTPESQDAIWELKRFAEGREVEAHSVMLPDRKEDQWIEGFARGEDGSFLVVDSDLDALLRFDRSWRYLESWRKTKNGDELAGLSGIHEGKSGIWLLEQRSHRVRLIQRDGTEVRRFGEPGRGPGQLWFPQDLVECPGKWIAVADLGNYRVQRFELNGQPLDHFAPEPAAPGKPLQLLDITVSPSCDRLYVVDSKGGRVLVTTPTGKLLQTISRW